MPREELLPFWDLNSIFPDIDPSEFARAIDELERDIVEFGNDVAWAELEPALTAVQISALLDDFNTILALAIRIDGFANCHALSGTAGNSASRWLERTAFAWNRLESINRRLMVAATRLAGGRAHATDTLRAHRFWLTKARTVATHMLSPDTEHLASELAGSGSIRWQQLRDQIVDDLTLEPNDASTEPIPFVTLQQRASHPDRTVRHNAYRLEISAWENNALVISTAYSAIKSEAATLSRMRGWDSPLDQSLSDNHIDREVLNAMLRAADEVLPDFQRYLRSKAALLGLSRLAWYDLFSPVSGDGVRWSFEDAQKLIVDVFSSYSGSAGAFATHVSAAGWIDAATRPGKRGGGLCVPLGDGESRLLVNYTPTYAGLRMVAHELGHAWHIQCLHNGGRTAVQQIMTPWVLSETTALFFEVLVRDAALQRANHAQLLVETETTLQYWCRHVVDVLSAFRFESSVFERIERGPLTQGELCALMRHVQSTTYGDAIDPETYHPYMWAAKPHGFSAASSFNSYPYMFGTLLSLGLFAQYRSEPERFPRVFDEFLSSTGIGDAATLMSGFGIDLRSEEFWRYCTAIIRNEIERFEALASQARGDRAQ